MRWHLFVQELSAALQPPSLAEGAAEKVDIISMQQSKSGHHQNSSNSKIDMCLEEEEENIRQRTLSAVWRCGKRRVGLKCFIPAEGTIHELRRQEFQNFPREMPSLKLRDVSSASALAMPKTGYYFSRLT